MLSAITVAAWKSLSTYSNILVIKGWSLLIILFFWEWAIFCLFFIPLYVEELCMVPWTLWIIYCENLPNNIHFFKQAEFRLQNTSFWYMAAPTAIEFFFPGLFDISLTCTWFKVKLDIWVELRTGLVALILWLLHFCGNSPSWDFTQFYFPYSCSCSKLSSPGSSSQQDCGLPIRVLSALNNAHLSLLSE